MKKFIVLLGGYLLAPLMLPGAETAQAQLFCLSVRFHQGSDTFGLYHLDLSTIDLDSPNGELAPTFDSPDHFSGFRLSDAGDGSAIAEGQIAFDTPAFADVNGNGFDDFFEVSQAAGGTATGEYDAMSVDTGTVQAAWNRPAGSKDGTCVLRLRSNALGDLGTFTHTCELIEYTGTMSYTPASATVAGTMQLTQTGNPSSQLAGPFLFVKSQADRFNELELQPGVWTNAAGGSLVFTNDTFYRDEFLRTNYYGYVDFDDGDPNTPDVADYYTWILSIDDLNDANRNGIPDFTDDVSGTNARPPKLALTRGSTNLSLSISGTVGRTHEIQQTFSLSQPDWGIVVSFTLTNDPQTVSLAVPTNAASFWRVRAP